MVGRWEKWNGALCVVWYFLNLVSGYLFASFGNAEDLYNSLFHVIIILIKFF